MTKKQRLLDCFRTATENDMSYMALITRTKSELQVAIVEYKNYPSKIEQITRNYGNSLKLKRNKDIEIIDFCCGDSMEDILYDILTIQEEGLCI